MSLKFKLDNLDGLDDAVKAFYKQTDGGFILDVEGAEGEEAIKGLRSAMQKERDRAAKLQREFDRLGGRSTEEILAILDEFESAKAGGKVDIKNLPEAEREALVKDLLDVRTRKYSREIEDLKKQLDEVAKAKADAESKYTGTLLDNQIRSVLTGKIVDSAIPDAVAIAKLALKYDPDDGKFRSEDGSDAEKWLSAQVEARPHWQKASHGSGAKGGAGAQESDSKGGWITGVFPK